MRVRPTIWVGLGVWVLYIAIILAIQATSGIPYTEWGDSASNLWRGAVISLAVGGVAIGGLSVWMGWWRAALRDRHRTGPRWALVAPALYVVISLGMLLLTSWSEVGLDFVVAALGLAVFVGFAEEFVCRGMLLVGLRGSLREVWVWALSCGFFGLMHGINILLGAPAGETGLQIVSAAVQGSALYLLRRVTGRLFWAMVLHGLWDFATFLSVESGAGPSIFNLLTLFAGPLALIAGFLVALQTDRSAHEDYAVGAPAPAHAST